MRFITIPIAAGTMTCHNCQYAIPLDIKLYKCAIFNEGLTYIENLVEEGGDKLLRVKQCIRAEIKGRE